MILQSHQHWSRRRHRHGRPPRYHLLMYSSQFIRINGQTACRCYPCCTVWRKGKRNGMPAVPGRRDWRATLLHKRKARRSLQIYPAHLHLPLGMLIRQCRATFPHKRHARRCFPNFPVNQHVRLVVQLPRSATSETASSKSSRATRRGRD